MRKLHCSFSIIQIDNEIIFVTDYNMGGMTITNDAEALVEYLNRLDPGKRIVYRDTDGVWSELHHTNGVFEYFKPYTGEIPGDDGPDSGNRL